MNSEIAERTAPFRRIGRSVAALFAGFVVNISLTLATDFGLHAAGILPPLGQPMNDMQSALATAYRALYGVISSYTVARFAPCRPMKHALIGAAIGMSLATLGAVATWSQGLGPRWYSLGLIVLALPTGWLGGKLREIQMQKDLG